MERKGDNEVSERVVEGGCELQGGNTHLLQLLEGEDAVGGPYRGHPPPFFFCSSMNTPPTLHLLTSSFSPS